MQHEGFEYDEDGILVLDRSVDRSIDIGECSGRWPFWMIHVHDVWWMKALLCIPITCSWIIWTISGKDTCP